jgi:hypothetical protein
MTTFEARDSMTPEHEKVLDWITKDYESHTYWKNLGKEMFLVSNGDSVLTRHRVADALRRSISGHPTTPVTVSRWNDDFTAILAIEVDPPAIAVANQLYVDWIQIADYVLLAAAASFERLEEENQRRKEAFDRARNGYEARRLVGLVTEFLEQNPEASEDAVIAASRELNLDVKKAHIALARKLATKSDSRQRRREVEPTAPIMLGTYQSIHHE